MSETIRTINLTNNTVISDRDITSNQSICAIDVNQVDGSYVVVEPYNSDGSYGGRVVLYPQSLQSSNSIVFQTFNRVGSLYYPRDAKFDYIRRKIWICDTGNNRVLKLNMDTNQIDLSIDENLIYPYAVAIDLNDGNIFIKGYQLYDLNYGSIRYCKKDGTLLATFFYNKADIESSSSSSSESSGNQTISSTSSSGNYPPTNLPSSHSIVCDSTRSRVWWVDGVKIYMMDIRNKQIQTYDVRNDHFYSVISIDIELSTGNAFVVAKDIHGEWFLIQMFRDNNLFLGSAYIQG